MRVAVSLDLHDTTAMRWRTRPAEGLMWEMWESEYSLFNPASGETHLIDELTAEVLRRASDRPITVHDLATELANIIEIENTTAWQQRIAALLGQLEALGLVEPASD